MQKKNFLHGMKTYSAKLTKILKNTGNNFNKMQKRSGFAQNTKKRELIEYKTTCINLIWMSQGKNVEYSVKYVDDMKSDKVVTRGGTWSKLWFIQLKNSIS